MATFASMARSSPSLKWRCHFKLCPRPVRQQFARVFVPTVFNLICSYCHCGGLGDWSFDLLAHARCSVLHTVRPRSSVNGVFNDPRRFVLVSRVVTVDLSLTVRTTRSGLIWSKKKDRFWNKYLFGAILAVLLVGHNYHNVHELRDFNACHRPCLR